MRQVVQASLTRRRDFAPPLLILLIASLYPCPVSTLSIHQLDTVPLSIFFIPLSLILSKSLFPRAWV